MVRVIFVMNEEQPTCGKGLAEHSVVPAKMAEWLAAMADNLELHQKTLISRDENTRRELEAYVRLTSAYQRIAEQLQATATEMAGYRDLPMGEHDEAPFTDPKFGEAFARFVQLERELLNLLQTALTRDEQMLGRE